ncbi:MAG: UDP-3-O-acyl-N-acetylglucosamine deacetylase [Kiritimatiellia bacterium]
MEQLEIGTLLEGDQELLRRATDEMAAQPVDEERMAVPEGDAPWLQTTIAKPVAVTGPGTFLGKAQRRLEFVPTSKPGWRFERTDLANSLDIEVSVRTIWTTARNIVLCSGSPHNYMRMVEHIVALKYLGLDNVLIRLDSGDPPLFERSSMDLVEALDRACIVQQHEPARVFSVKEPVSITASNGGFLTFLPAQDGNRRLTVDCAVNFATAIGKQRIRFDVNPETFRHGAAARTNTHMWMMLYCKTVGKLFADTRNLGYSLDNILVAGPRHYVNKPLLVHNGKSLEAVWHRAVLDLLAAVALIDLGRFAGHIISYKAGHTLDCDMIRLLYQRDLLEEI